MVKKIFINGTLLSISDLQYARDPTGDEIFAPKPFKLANLLPKYTMSFYRYNGSLTMPDCSEMVSWTIFMVSGRNRRQRPQNVCFITSN